MERLESGSRPQVKLRSARMVTVLLVLLLSVLFAVPGVRAEIVRFFRVGVVRIFPSVPTLTAEPALPQFPTTTIPTGFLPTTATPQADSTPGEPLYAVTMSGLAGETSLAEAQIQVPFPIRLPDHPPELGAPDRVFVQEDGLMVILVWVSPDDPKKARLSLHEIGQGSISVSKFEPRTIQETQVNGQYAIWVQGPYMVQLTNGTYDFRRLVEGNTLIWEKGEITYRLETDLSLEETAQIAASLK